MHVNSGTRLLSSNLNHAVAVQCNVSNSLPLSRLLFLHLFKVIYVSKMLSMPVTVGLL